MNLFTKIKKIIACALLACVLVSIVPVQIFAQSASTTTNTTQTKYSGLLAQGVKIYDGSTLGLGPVSSGKTENIGIAQYNELKRITGGLINPRTSGDAYESSKIYHVSTTDGNAAYYYAPNGSTDPKDSVLIAYVSEKTLFIPPAGYVGKASEGTDVKTTEEGFLSEIDKAQGKPAETFKNLGDVDQIKYNQDQQKANSSELQKVNLILQTGLENGKQITDARRAELTNQKNSLEAKDKELQEKINNGQNAANGGTISTEACPSGIMSTMNILDPACVVSIMAIIANSILKLSAFVLYWTGNLFDYSIEIAVNSAEFLRKLNVIEPTWAFVRDALNMTFIFILLFVAVQILLGKNGYTAKGSVARLVLIAILMNFSLFAAKAMIDASNIVSLNIYEGIKSKQPGQSNDRGNVSERIMTTLGLSGVYNFGEIFDKKAIPGCGGAPGTILTVGIFGTILLVITSLTFLLAAVLFFLRMLNIIVLFVTSPIFVWGFVMENGFFKQKTAAWWTGMKHAVQFPVVYMLMLYVALAMFAQLNTAQIESGKRVSLIKLICDTSQTADASVLDKLPLILNFLIVIMSLIGIITYAAKKSGDGGLLTGKLSSQFSDKINNLQKKFTTGAAQGVYNKSRDVVVGTGNLALAGAGKVKDATLTLATAPLKAAGKGITDLTRMGANSVSNNIAERLAKAATGQGTLGSKLMNMPRAQAYLAGVSTKYKDRKIFGETEKEAVERRTKGTRARAEILATVQADQFKVLSEKEWKKKNPNGDSAQYEEYLKEKVSLIEKSQLGGLENKVAKVNSDGSTVTTEDLVRTDIYEDIKDNSGNVIGKRLNEEKLFKNIQDARKHHTETGDLLKADKSKRLGITTSERAKARFKAQDEALKKRQSEAKTKQGKAEQVKRKNTELEKLRKTIANEIPSDITSLDPNMSAADKNKYHKDVRSYLQEKKDIIDNRDKAIRNSTPSTDINKITQDAQNALIALDTTYVDKISTAKTKIEDRIEKLITDIDKLEEEKEKK